MSIIGRPFFQGGRRLNLAAIGIIAAALTRLVKRDEKSGKFQWIGVRLQIAQ